MHDRKSENPIEMRLKELYRLSKSGDQKAYLEFLQICSEVTKRFLLFIDRGGKLKDQHDDLSQDILFKIHSKKHTYREDKPILPWIHAVIRYAYIDQYRKLNLTKEIEAKPEIREIEKEEVVGLSEILDLLTPEQSELIQAISIEGKSFSEVAKNMKMKESTLRVRFHRMINELKARIVP